MIRGFGTTSSAPVLVRNSCISGFWQVLHAICSYNERWDFPTTGNSLFWRSLDILLYFSALIFHIT